jgi:hypothetical protein
VSISVQPTAFIADWRDLVNESENAVGALDQIHALAKQLHENVDIVGVRPDRQAVADIEFDLSYVRCRLDAAQALITKTREKHGWT